MTSATQALEARATAAGFVPKEDALFLESFRFSCFLDFFCFLFSALFSVFSFLFLEEVFARDEGMMKAFFFQRA